jgi:hypothetical protein
MSDIATSGEVMAFSQQKMIMDKQHVTIRDKCVYVPYLPRHITKYHGTSSSTNFQRMECYTILK